MKYFYTQLFKLISLSIFLSFLFNLSAFSQYNGTQYVGAGEEFETIQEAVDSLVSQGVDGADTIIVRAKSGHYNEQIDIAPIPGASATFTVTFQSETKIPDDVWIFYGATGSSNNYVVRFNGCDYVTFEYFKMINSTLSVAYNTVIGFNGTAEYNKIKYNTLIGSSGTPTSDETAVIQMYREIVNGTEISHNEIQGGSYAVRFDIVTFASEISTNVKINYNICNSYRGISLEDQYKVEIIGNEINSDYGSALYLQICKDDIKILNNKISSYHAGSHSGIYLSDVDGQFAFRGMIANNVVYVNADNNGDLNRGIYLTNSSYQYIYHNTVYLRNTNTSGYAFIADGDGIEVEVKNNLFAVANYGYAYGTATSTNVSVSDYNNYFTPGNYLAVWNGGLVGELSDLQIATSQDDSSKMIYPSFISGADITGLIPQTHWLDGKGDDLSATIDYDIDSVARPSSPDFGAYEFAATNSSTYSGTLTIQASGGTFTSFSEAVDSLMKLGVSGLVTINVEDNTYSERVDLRSIPGVNASNPLVFQSTTGDSTKVILQYATLGTSNNWTVLFEGTDHVTFKNMTIKNTGATSSRVFRFNGKCHDITITNCILTGNGVAADSDAKAIISSWEDDTDNFTITNNIFKNGDRAISLFGASSTDKTTGLLISNNQISGYHRSIIIDNFTDFEISNNLVEDFTYTGIGVQYCNSPYVIKNNRIFSDLTTYAGLWIYRCDGSGDGSLIYNNFIYIDGTGSISGIYCYLSGYQSFYNNSINLVSTSASAKAMDYQYGGTKTNIIIKNNNLFVDGPGYPMYIEGANVVISESDHNNLYTNGTYVARWISTSYTDIASLFAVSGMDEKSVSYNPGYTSITDLHTNSYWLDGAGVQIPSSLVTDDIDGETRLNPPDIGADEYSDPIKPYGGEYTLGTSGRFETFNIAIDSLIERGVLDTVIFKVQTGNYNEQFVIPQIAGVSSDAVIIFESESGNAADVVVAFNTGTSNNYLVKFSGADYITLKDLTFNTGGNSYTRILSFEGNSQYVKILDNVFNGITPTSVTNNQSLIYVPADKIVDNLLIQGNTFTDNSYGIYFGGNLSYDHTNIKVVNNKFNNQYRQVYFYRTKNPYIAGNELNEGKQEGIYLNECDNDLMVLKNKIFSSDPSFYAIYLNKCDGTTGYKGLIANNFVGVNGVSGSYGSFGIKLDVSNYQQVFHNTLSITGSLGSNFNTYQGGNLDLANNIFVNSGTTTYSYSAGSAVISSNNNDFYSTGTNNIRYNGVDYSDLVSYQSGETLDLNSIDFNPMLTSETDFHLLGDSVVGKGKTLTSIVPTDFDGETRDLVNPDIGADEFSCVFFPPPVVEDVTVCSNDSIPSLYAEGPNIEWYIDTLSASVWTANEYDHEHTDPGVYTYYVTQSALACTSSPDSVVLTILTAPDLTSSDITHIDCQGTNYGAINLSVEGSTAVPFIYQWSNDEISKDIGNLKAGDYIVTVEDLEGCVEIDTFTVTTPTPIILTMDNEDTECDTSFGSVTVVASGGDTPYSYHWNTGNSTTVIDSLFAGIYIVDVTDNRGCTETGIVAVSDIGAPTISNISITDVKCYGSDNGAITIDVTGGVGSYIYEWSSEETTEDINTKRAGSYEIKVTDEDGCQAYESFKITEPNPIRITLDITETSCGQSNGAAEASVTGGTGAYSYLWNPSGTDTNITGLNLGSYNVRVTDANSCQTTKYFSISEIGSASIIIDSINMGTCGKADGGIYITPYGAYSTYTYLWNDPDNSTTQDLINVNPSNYSVTVSDAGGCDAVKVATIKADQPDPNPICMVSVDTATNYNEILWEKEYTEGVDYYRVYKQSTSGEYYKIGKVDVASESVFVDQFSDVTQRPWRYKLAVVDDCGVESDLSDHHKTMHLTINLGIDNSINLIWNHYEGFDYETYYIHRRSNTGWEVIDSVPHNSEDAINSYTDDNPIYDESLYYMIEIKHPNGGCDPATKGRRTGSRSNVTPPLSAPADNDAPAAPASLTTTEITDTTISLIWLSSKDNTDDIANEVYKNSIWLSSKGSTGVIAYEVYQNGILLEEVTDTVYKAHSLMHSTTYTFFVKAKDAAGNVSGESNSISPTTTTPVGIETINNNTIKHIKLYPNPSNGNLVLGIESTEKQEIWYEIYNINGVKVNDGYLGYVKGKLEQSINISKQSDGMYFIKIHSKSRIQVQRIILNK